MTVVVSDCSMMAGPAKHTPMGSLARMKIGVAVNPAGKK
jgi:hypothetical protein